MGWGHVVAQGGLLSDGSSGSQIPIAVLSGWGRMVHEHRTSRRPQAFVVGESSVPSTLCHGQWNVAVSQCDQRHNAALSFSGPYALRRNL